LTTLHRAEDARQRLREEQRTKILEAAKRVFARKGLAATMDDVAAEASVSHGLAYRYFANKEAIVRTLIEQALQAPSAGLQRIEEMPGTPGERLNFLVSAFVESRREHPQFYQLLGQVLHDEAMPNDFRAVVHRRGQVLQGVLRQLIVEGQATGEVAAGDPDQLVRAVLACLDGLTRWGASDPEHDNEHFPDAGIFLRMLKP
jgi:AcrR family transcriptional regulator